MANLMGSLVPFCDRRTGVCCRCAEVEARKLVLKRERGLGDLSPYACRQSRSEAQSLSVLVQDRVQLRQSRKMKEDGS